MIKITVDDVSKCYFCGAKEKKSGNSLHCWDIEYECGCKITGAISDKDIYLEEKCKKIKK